MKSDDMRGTGIPAETTLQFKLARELLAGRFRHNISVQQYLTTVTEAVTGPQVMEEATVEEVGERYRHGLATMRYMVVLINN